MTTVWKPQKKQTIFLARPEYEALYGDGAERPLWGIKRGGGRLAKGSISTGREKGDHFATWDGAERPLWEMKRGGGRLAKESISTGREKGDHFATRGRLLLSPAFLSGSALFAKERASTGREKDDHFATREEAAST